MGLGWGGVCRDGGSDAILRKVEGGPSELEISYTYKKENLAQLRG